MTGTRPDSTKVWDLVTHFRAAEPNVVTIPEHFKMNGYFVQAMGKIYHPGYDDPQSWSVPWQTPSAPNYAKVKSAEVKDEDEVKSKGGPAFESADVPDNFYKDGMVADLAVKTLGELKKRPEPFFFAVGFAKPHLPFVAPKKYWDLYDPATIQLAPNPYHPKDAPSYALSGTSELRNYVGIPSEGPIPDSLARQLKHGYYASVSYTDAQIGKVLQELDRLDLTRNTIVVLWGDHGWKLGEHGEWTKHTNVENDTNAPLLMAVPGMNWRGCRCRAIWKVRASNRCSIIQGESGSRPHSASIRAGRSSWAIRCERIATG
jgi:arylsulfatase A-like enzyme